MKKNLLFIALVVAGAFCGCKGDVTLSRDVKGYDDPMMQNEKQITAIIKNCLIIYDFTEMFHIFLLKESFAYLLYMLWFQFTFCIFSYHFIDSVDKQDFAPHSFWLVSITNHNHRLHR